MALVEKRKTCLAQLQYNSFIYKAHLLYDPPNAQIK